MIRLAILVGWLGCIAVQAQQTQSSPNTSSTSDAYWNLTSIPSQAQATLRLSNTTIPDPTSSLNEVTTSQIGSGNAATLSILSGSQNRLESNQFSNQNTATVTLSGTNNSIVVNQLGGSNNISFGLDGTNNRFMLSQDGGDRLQMQGLQQNNTRLEITQGSGNNTLTIDNTPLFRSANGTGIPNLRIEQSGGATAIIQNGLLIGN